MEIKELVGVIGEGMNPVIKATKLIEEYCEESLDPFMVGRAVDARIVDEDSYRILLDMNGYEAHNRAVAQFNWLDSDRNPTLSWMETEYYPSNGIASIYLPLEGESPFEIEEENSLLNEYISGDREKSYIEWLEETILQLRKTPDNK